MTEPEQEPAPCPLCERPNHFPSKHHMIPKSKGGNHTQTLCADCHQAIHAHFTNTDLKLRYHTSEALLADERFSKTVSFLRKQDPRRRYRTRVAKDRRR